MMSAEPAPGTYLSIAANQRVKREDERWLIQSKVGGGHVPPEERGDCVAACMASVLGVPLHEVDNCHGEGWWDRLHDSLARHGYCAVIIDSQWEPPRGLWIASLPSLNLGPEPSGKTALHTIVCRYYDFVHDPSLGERYDEAKWREAWNADEVVEGWVLVPLDAATLRSSLLEQPAKEGERHGA